MTQFYQVILAKEKKDLESIEFPCTVIVWWYTEEARKEAVDLVFKHLKLKHNFWLPASVAIVSWLMWIAISILCYLGKI